MFHDIANGKLRLPDAETDIHVHDVETLNRNALVGTFDFTKASFHAYLLVRKAYTLLHTGATLGFGCGPLLVGKRNMSRGEISHCRLAVPGELTTAHLLLRLWAPEAGDKMFVPYDRIMGMVAGGEADAGVIIHEGRFVYEQAGLKCLVDLGRWWEQLTGAPIPLGCILARTKLARETISGFENILKRAIENSLAEPERAREYVKKYAQEINDDVIGRHINTFVNKHSLHLGQDGEAAVKKLERMAREAGVVG